MHGIAAATGFLAAVLLFDPVGGLLIHAGIALLVVAALAAARREPGSTPPPPP